MKINEWGKPHRWLASTLAGMLMGFAFPHTGSLFPLAFIAWVPLLLVEHQISNKRYRWRKVFAHAYWTFFLYNFIATWWISYASIGGAAMAILANAAVMATAFQLYHFAKKYLGKKEGHLGLIILWLGFEYTHFHWELSWPWLNLGNYFANVPALVQWYDTTGILGGSLWILTVNLLLYRICYRVWGNKETIHAQGFRLIALALVLIIPTSISLVKFYKTPEKGKTLSVQVLQPNVDPYTEKFRWNMETQVNRLIELSAENGGDTCDLVLAPETVLPYEFYEEDLQRTSFYARLYNEVRENKQHWYLGASTRRFFEEPNSPASRAYSDGPGYWESYNSSLVIGPEGPSNFIHKSKLVLGVERVPFIGLLPFLDKFALDMDGTSGTLGIEGEPRVLEQPKAFAPVVCYESVYGEWVAEQCKKGAELICVITNDGWWNNTPGHRQHFDFSRLRAIETGRWVARSANTGISGFINPKGEAVAQSQYDEMKALSTEVVLSKKESFYIKHGDVLGRTAAFVAVFLLLYALRKKFKRLYGDPGKKEIKKK